MKRPTIDQLYELLIFNSLRVRLYSRELYSWNYSDSDYKRHVVVHAVISQEDLELLKQTYGKKFATVQRCAIIAKYLKLDN